MSNDPDDLDPDDESADGTTDTTNAPKGLRSKVKAQDEQIAKLIAENAKLAAGQRSRTLAEALEANGASAKLAKFYPSEKEASDDDVLKWLQEDGELFGWSADGASDDDPDTVEQAELIGRASSQAPQRRIQGGLTVKELATGDYKDLQKRGLVL